MNKLFLTTKEISEKYGFTEGHIRVLVNKKGLPFQKRKGFVWKILIKETDAEEFFKKYPRRNKVKGVVYFAAK